MTDRRPTFLVGGGITGVLTGILTACVSSFTADPVVADPDPGADPGVAPSPESSTQPVPSAMPEPDAAGLVFDPTSIGFWLGVAVFLLGVAAIVAAVVIRRRQTPAPK